MATARLYTPTGEEKGTVDLPEWAFGSRIHRHVMWEVVRNYLATCGRVRPRSKPARL